MNRKTITLTEKEKELLRSYGEDIDKEDYEVYEIVDDSSDFESNDEEYDLLENAEYEVDDFEYQKEKSYKKELRRKEKEERKKQKQIKKQEKENARRLEKQNKIEKNKLLSIEKENIKNELRDEIKEDVTYQVKNELFDDYNEEPVNKKVTEETIVYKKEKKFKKLNFITNLIFIIIVLAICMIAIDIVRVKKYNKLPLFAIPLHTYKDGGTKEYYGIGYKVIDYYQLQGKRGKEIGTWFLKYDTEPFATLNAVDLAIEANNNEEKTFNKYNNKFIKITAKLKSIEKSTKEITAGYDDEDDKYTLDIVCGIAGDKEELNYLEIDYETTIVGTVREFEYETGTNPTTFYLTDCYIEQ